MTNHLTDIVLQEVIAERDAALAAAARYRTQRDEARMYEKHNAIKLIGLRTAVNNYLRFLRTGEHVCEDDSLLSLLDDIEKAL